MTTKDYGAGTSGYLDPQGRNWETTVYQAGKPVLDKELNLVQDTEQDALSRLRRVSFPSGWVSRDFLDTSVQGAFVDIGPSNYGVASNLLFLASLEAFVNGWSIQVQRTNYTAAVPGITDPGLNRISLGAGPAGAGAQRTDLVILEVASAHPGRSGYNGQERRRTDLAERQRQDRSG
jgi:hypothetical protein